MSWLSPGLLLKICWSVLPVCMYVCVSHAYLVLLEVREGIRSLGTELMGSFEYVGTRAKPVSSVRTANALNH